MASTLIFEANTDGDVAEACYAVRFGEVFFPTLHPSTSPERIAARQRRELSVLLRGFRKRRVVPTLSELSEALVLPVWSVRRHLAALGLDPEGYR